MTAMLVIGLLMAVGVMFAEATPSSSGNAAANPDSFVPCPAHLVAPYGGSGGWSTVNVQANFARAGYPTRHYGLPVPLWQWRAVLRNREAVSGGSALHT